jgi:PilZ domain
MASMDPLRTPRRAPRRQVEFEGAVHLGGDLLVGSVLDLSPHGAFFRPEAGVIEGAFTQIDPRRPPLRVHDQITVDIRHVGGTVATTATVRWLGHSDLHHTAGVGLEFAFELRHAALLPKLD